MALVLGDFRDNRSSFHPPVAKKGELVFAMLRRIFAVTAAALLLVSLPSHAGVNKCTDASGKTVYSDQPCLEGGKQQRLDIKSPATPSQTMGRTATGFDPQQYCRDGNRDLTEAEMSARMEAFSRSGYPGGQICCKDGKVAQCGDLLK